VLRRQVCHHRKGPSFDDTFQRLLAYPLCSSH
jgi:hypothetical protein